MKKIFFLILLPVLFSLAFAPDEKEVTSSANYLDESHLISPRQKLKSKQISLEGHLVAHDRFVFVKYLDLDKSDLDSNSEITHEFNKQSSRFHAYKLTDSKIQANYRALLGQTFELNNHDRKQFEVTIEKLVIVFDESAEKPYLAALIDDFGTENIYYAWLGKHQQNPYAFSVVELSEEEQLTLNNELIETGEQKKFKLDDYEWFDEYTTIKEFKSLDGNHYRVVQYSALAECASIIESEIKIYKIDKKGVSRLIAKTSTDMYFVDLLDLNDDGQPELLLGDYASAQLMEISNQSMKKIQALSWSYYGCPC